MPWVPRELPQQHSSGVNPDQSPSCRWAVLGAPCVAFPLSNELSCGAAASVLEEGKSSLSLPQLHIFASPVDLSMFAGCRPSVHRYGNAVKVY